MGEAKRRREAEANRHPDEKVVFALDAGRTTVILGVPRPAYEKVMLPGKNHNFNLRALGFPVNIVLTGGETRGHVLDLLNPLIAKPQLHDYRADHSIPEDEKAMPRMRQAAAAWLEKEYGRVEIPEAKIDELIAAILTLGEGE